MTDWIKHNGGPQPVDEDVWVEVLYPGTAEGRSRRIEQAISPVWTGKKFRWRILNQHLIDAARKDGFEAGMEKSAAIADSEGRQNIVREADDNSIAAARLEGIRLGLEAAQSAVEELHDYDLTDREIAIEEAAALIFGLNPETIARDCLTKPAPSDLPPSSSDILAKEAGQ